MAIIKSQFTLRLDLETHAKIKKLAEKENRSLTNMIETILKNKISDYEKENGEIIVSDDELYDNWKSPAVNQQGSACR